MTDNEKRAAKILTDAFAPDEYWLLNYHAEPLKALITAALDEAEKRAIKRLGDRVEYVAWQIPSPNPYTPQLIQAVIEASDELGEYETLYEAASKGKKVL